MKTKPEFTRVPIAKIADNPLLATAHVIHKDKVRALTESIRDVGFFEGIHGRPGPNKTIELMFGHHRVKACEKAGLTHVYVIIRPYTDREMIKGFSRENESSKTVDVAHFAEAWLAMERDLVKTGELPGGAAAPPGKAPGQNDQDWRNLVIARAFGSDSPWLRKHIDGGDRLSEQGLAISSLVEVGVRPSKLTHRTVKSIRGAVRKAKKFKRQIDKEERAETIYPQDATEYRKALAKKLEDVFSEPDARTPDIERDVLDFIKEEQNRLEELKLYYRKEELPEELEEELEYDDFDEQAAEEEVEEEIVKKNPVSTDDADEEREDKMEQERERRIKGMRLEHAIYEAIKICERTATALQNATSGLLIALDDAPVDLVKKAELRKVQVALKAVRKESDAFEDAIARGFERPKFKVV